MCPDGHPRNLLSGFPNFLAILNQLKIPKAATLFRARQRSGEGVVRGNGRPKGCFWSVRSSLPQYKVCPENT